MIRPEKPTITMPPGVLNTRIGSSLEATVLAAIELSVAAHGDPRTIWCETSAHANTVRRHLYPLCQSVRLQDHCTHEFRGMDVSDRPWCVEVYDHPRAAAEDTEVDS